ALSLIIRMNSEWSHPALDARAMDHVECRDSVARIAPYHRAFFGISDGEFPYCRIQVRYANTYHSVFPITLGERLAENRVERWDLADAGAFWRLRNPGVSPVTGKRHHAAPASRVSSGNRGRTRVLRSPAIGSSSSPTPIYAPPPSLSI